MSNNPMCNPLRREAQRLFGGGLRVSRGDALYYAPPGGWAKKPESEWFRAEPAGGAAIIRPTEAAVRAFEDWARERVAPGTLGRELGRRSGEAITAPELELFALGVKQMELQAPPAAWAAFDKRLRQLGADCLREGRGGGALYACWACMALSLNGDTIGAF